VNDPCQTLGCRSRIGGPLAIDAPRAIAFSFI
jgi:hypothetical protein